MKDEYTTKVTTDLNGFGGPPEDEISKFYDFNNGNPGSFRIQLPLAGRISGGVAFVFRRIRISPIKKFHYRRFRMG
jgi:hypothetical protein